MYRYAGMHAYLRKDTRRKYETSEGERAKSGSRQVSVEVEKRTKRRRSRRERSRRETGSESERWRTENRGGWIERKAKRVVGVSGAGRGEGKGGRTRREVVSSGSVVAAPWLRSDARVHRLPSGDSRVGATRAWPLRPVASPRLPVSDQPRGSSTGLASRISRLAVPASSFTRGEPFARNFQTTTARSASS